LRVAPNGGAHLGALGGPPENGEQFTANKSKPRKR